MLKERKGAQWVEKSGKESNICLCCQIYLKSNPQPPYPSWTFPFHSPALLWLKLVQHSIWASLTQLHLHATATELTVWQQISRSFTIGSCYDWAISCSLPKFGGAWKKFMFYCACARTTHTFFKMSFNSATFFKMRFWGLGLIGYTNGRQPFSDPRKSL